MQRTGNRIFGYMFCAQLISILGDSFSFVALQWLVYKTSGSLLVMGTFAMVAGLTEVVVRFMGAPMLDRWNRYHCMVWLDMMRLTAIGVTVVLSLSGIASLSVLFIMVIVTSAGAALFKPASMAVLPSILQSKKLVRGYSLMDTSQYAAAVVGPSIAGILVSIVGAEIVLGLDALSFGASGLLILAASRGLPDVRAREVGHADSINAQAYLREIWDGMRFFKQVPPLAWIMSCVSIKNMCSVAVAGMMVPFAIQVLHTDG